MAGNFGIDLVTKIMIFSIFALSLELLVGGTGLVCFGQAAFFGIGAYAAVKLSPESEAASLLWLLPASVLLAARVRPVRRLAVAAHQGRVLHHGDAGVRADGLLRGARHAAGRRHRRHLPQRQAGPVRGRRILDLGKPLVFYGFTLACLVLVFVFLAVLLRSRFGRALDGIRVNEQRMRATGFSTYPYKLAAFTVSGGIAGLGGFLFAVKDGFVNPELLSWHESGAVLIMIILGGIGHLRGALVGAFAFALLQELFKSEAVFGTLRQALASRPGADHHRQRGAAAQGPGRHAGDAARAARGQRYAPRRRAAGSAAWWLKCCCAAAASRGAGAAWSRSTT